MNSIKTALSIMLGGMFAANAFAASVEEDVHQLQQNWAKVKYEAPAAEQEKQFQNLTADAGEVVAQYPGRPEALIWHGIIEASYAGAKGGLGALSLVKDARRDFEEALKIDPKALSGSAYTSLGTLYYQVPGWPIGFGDDKKAQEYLKQGLAINPDGIDSNFFYGDFLYRSGKLEQAEQYLHKALEAPPRPGRKLADEGRRKEINALLEKIAQQRK